MTDDMPMDDRPLKLGDLAQTESPEIVRAALGRFRRRLLVRGLIVVLVVAAGFALYPRYFAVHGDLIHDIQHGHGVTVDRTLRLGPIDAHVREVARLSRAESPLHIQRYGIHVSLIVARMMAMDDRIVANLVPARIDYFPGPTPKVSGVFQVTQQTGGLYGPFLDLWISLTPGTRTVDIPIALASTERAAAPLRPIGTIHLDMKQLNVPDWIWR